MRPLRRPAAALSASLLSAAVALAACSSASTPAASVSASGSTDAGVAYAKAQVEKFTAVPTFDLKAEPFDIKGVAGKKIFNIPSSSQVPYVVEVDKEGAKLAEKYGATWTEYSNKGNPTEWAAGVDQAVNQKVDLIILSQGVNPALLKPSLQRAKAAGIPVLVSHAYEAGTTVPADVAEVTSARVDAPFNESGRLEADWAIADTGGKAHALVITSSEVPPSNGIVDAIKDEFAQHCAGCTVTVANVPLTDWVTKIGPTVQSQLQAHPDINYVLPIYDSMSIYAQAGITAGGATGKVKIATFNGTLSILEMLAKGSSVTMDVGENTTWLAWATFDQGARLMTKAPLITTNDAKTPLRIFSATNVAEVGSPPVTGKGFGDAYVTGYEKLWGVAS